MCGGDDAGIRPVSTLVKLVAVRGGASVLAVMGPRRVLTEEEKEAEQKRRSEKKRLLHLHLEEASLCGKTRCRA